MNTQTLRNSAAILFASFALCFAGAASADAPMKKEMCLQCHGPLENLLKLEPKYETDSGKINPHKYVPHDAADPAKFPECTTCHTPHAMPPAKGFKDKSANIEYCYSCHHNYTFQKCSECHK